ncbi:MAG: serine hydrolase [Candidatus Aminicenantes bacterium]|nr:serine hydrolase [Candidatus Aminicenantes bacterium]
MTWTAALLAASAFWAAGRGQAPSFPPVAPAVLEKALAYAKSHNGLSLVILQDGRTILEDYHNGFEKGDSHILTSGTKSFSGVLLAALIDDGIVSSFDEKVSEAVAEWRSDPQKRDITLRDLLSLTSGLDAGPIGRVLPYAQALQSKVLHPRGTFFQYGPAPFQVFGEFVKRKLQGETALSFLTTRVFRPIGLQPTGWRFGQDRNPNLASGADLRAGEWAKFGELVRRRGRWGDRTVVSPDLIEELLKPSKTNPAYGLGFWLKTGSGAEAEEGGGRTAQEPELQVIMAAGAGKQRLYIIDELGLVVARQGKASSFLDGEFLQILLGKR